MTKRTVMPEVEFTPLGSAQKVVLHFTDYASEYRTKTRFWVATRDGSEKVAELVVACYSSEQGARETAKWVNEELRRGRIGGPTLSARLKREGFMVAESAALIWLKDLV